MKFLSKFRKNTIFHEKKFIFFRNFFVYLFGCTIKNHSKCFLLKKRLTQKKPIKIINYNQEKFPVVLFQINLFIGNKNQKYQNKKISIHYSYFFGFE